MRRKSSRHRCRRDLSVALRDRIASDIAAVGEGSEISSRLRPLGIAVRIGTPAQFSAAIEEQRAKVGEIVSAQSATR